MNTRMTIRGQGALCLVGIGITIFTTSSVVQADRMTSTNYKLDTSVGAPTGGAMGSTNYKMTTSGGEGIAGVSASGSYKLGQGYVAQLAQSIQLSLTPATLALGTINAGVSNTATLTSQIQTDAPSYALAINQNNDLKNGSYTIPAITGGTIAAPTGWTEGTTKGLGLTITGGPSVPGKWGASGSYNYAAIPNTATTLFSRSGFTGGATDTITMQTRLDTVGSQPSGNYTNSVTVTATMIP